MRILLTNDDGIHAPGIRALLAELKKLGEVTVVAPQTEQSGVGHTITFLKPLMCQKVVEDGSTLGWAVDGSPADSVRIGLFEFCPKPPDLIVSGINFGLNVGINVLYSGTVAAAIEGAFYGITSVAVSMEQSQEPRFDSAAKIARSVIETIVEKQTAPQLYNLNFPTVATRRPIGGDQVDIRVVPMGTSRYGEDYVKRTDPKGRDYFWATTDPPPSPSEHETDLTAVHAGNVTLTPLSFNMTDQSALQEMKSWQFSARSC